MSGIVDWPLGVLKPRDVAVAPAYDTRPAQAATNGMRRVPGVTAGRFRLRLKEIPVHDQATHRTMMAMLGLMEGGAALVRFRLPNLYGIDGPFSAADRARRAAYPNGVPFASDALFSSGVGFAPSYRAGALAEAAPLAAREIMVAEAEELPGGSVVSIDEFTYVARRAWQEEEGLNRIELSPVLRKAAAAATTVEYAPVFVGTCVTDTPGFEEMRAGKFGTFTFEFVEDLTRLVAL